MINLKWDGNAGPILPCLLILDRAGRIPPYPAGMPLTLPFDAIYAPLSGAADSGRVNRQAPEVELVGLPGFV